MKNNSKQLELLSNTTTAFEEEFYKYSTQFSYKKGSSPFYPDDLLKYFYVIVDGRVKTYQINFQTNKEQTFFIYKRGDMFDLISLLDGKPHEVIYEVIEDANVLRIPIDKVRYWLENYPAFNKKIFPYLAAHMRYTEELAEELALYDTKERFLNLLVQNLNPENKFRYQLLQNLSNTEIAKLIGTVRHVLERSIKELKAENIIATSRRNIKINSLQKLLEKSSKMLLK
ncbi:Crp/Fnr family transcriptional regulator [Sulfurimonas sp.]|uniref:Crp/Fnr family transcriptional regulator n=1 Tax=Sulfurimonas sp. TaxID=2022749 RepID=UPI00260A88FF|nr:Crp/Fnr family transcriptional regulator [Sulfurimonas sp.]